MSRDCDEALTDLYTYLDEELDAVSSSQIRAHLDACTDCGHAFDFETRLKSVVRERLDEEVPDQLVNRVRAAIEEEKLRS